MANVVPDAISSLGFGKLRSIPFIRTSNSLSLGIGWLHTKANSAFDLI